MHYSDQIRSIKILSPILKTLLLFGCYKLVELKIDTPNLCFFRYMVDIISLSPNALALSKIDLQVVGKLTLNGVLDVSNFLLSLIVFHKFWLCEVVRFVCVCNFYCVFISMLFLHIESLISFDSFCEDFGYSERNEAHSYHPHYQGSNILILVMLWMACSRLHPIRSQSQFSILLQRSFFSRYDFFFCKNSKVCRYCEDDI